MATYDARPLAVGDRVATAPESYEIVKLLETTSGEPLAIVRDKDGWESYRLVADLIRIIPAAPEDIERYLQDGAA